MSFCVIGSSKVRPIRRLIAKKVRSGLVTAWRLAGWPTRRSPSSVIATMDGVFNFRPLLIKAPSGLMIEPPIVRESLEAIVIEQGGDEAAVADQILRINKQAKIVTARHFGERFIPDAGSLRRKIEAGSEAMMALTPEQFAA